MRITEVAIENWRNIHRLTLALDSPITIVHGPNEAGKSSVQEAIRHALLAEASSSASELKALVSWGSAAKAHVALTLVTQAGERLRIEKSFPRGEARLLRLEPTGEEMLIAEGRTVQSRIFPYLGVPPEAADLFSLLWISQGESLALFSGRPEEGPVKGPAQTLIKSIIKENLLSGRAEELYRELTKEHDEVFQKSGKPRKGSRLGDLEQREQELVRALSAADAELSEAEGLASELARVESAIEELDGLRTREERALEALERKHEAKRRLEPKEQAFAGLEERHRRLLTSEAREREAAERLPSLLARKEAAVAEWGEAHAQRRRSAETLRARLEEVERSQSEARVSERKVLEELDGSLRIIREARLRLEASQLTVRVASRGDSPVSLEVSRDEGGLERVSLEGTGEWRAARAVRLSLPAGLDIDCTGPLSREEWEGLRGRIEGEEGRLSARLAEIGCSTVEEAKEAFDGYVHLQAERSGLEAKLAGLLGPEGQRLEHEKEALMRAEEELKDERAHLGRLDAGSSPGGSSPGGSSPGGSSPGGSSPGGSSPAGSSGFEARSNRLPGGSVGAEAGGSASEAGAGSSRGLGDPEERIRRLSGALSLAVRDIEESRRDRSEILAGSSREEFRRELFSLKEEIAHAREELAAMEPVDVAEVGLSELKRKRDEIARVGQQLGERRERQSALAAIQSRSGGLIERKERHERDLAGVQVQLAEERRRIGAVDLLIGLIEEQKEAIDRNILSPLQERLTDAFRQVVGERYVSISVGDHLGIGGLAAPVHEGQTEVAIDSLSYGTREQLSFLFRLLLAQYLSNREPQVMMLDDTFVNTDSGRRERLFEMMSGDTTGLQFVLFTCHGDHYDAYRERDGVRVIEISNQPA